MRPSRKLALALVGAVVSLLVLLLAVPALLGGRIESRLKSEIARSTNARVDWRQARLSVVRDFPNATLALADLTIAGTGPFEGQTLAIVRQVRLVLDLGSVVRYMRSGDRIVVREVRLERPVVNLRVLRDGTANWDIARKPKGPAADSSSPVDVTLRELSIVGGTITLADRQSGLDASVLGLQQSLRGDFAQERITLVSRTRADSVSVRFAGLPYLSHVALELNTDVDADLTHRRFTFKNDLLRLNKLRFALSGTVAARDTNLAIDVAFSSPSTAFADILSLVPVIYAHDFARLQTAGRMSVAGRVSGSYGPTAFPAFALRARVDGGAFRYPDLPLPARDISLDLSIDNPGGHADSTVVSVKRFHAVVGQQPLDAWLVMRTPVSDPDLDLRVRGTVDLASLARTVKLTDVQELSGSVAADVALRARMSALDVGQYERVAASGTIGASRVAVRTASLPHAVMVDTAALRLTPRRTELTAFAARAGKSDVRATGSLDNLLGFVMRGAELRGQASVSSAQVDLDEWRSDDSLTVIPVPANVDFAVQAAAARVKYGAVTATNVRGGLRVKNQRVTLEDLRMETMRGSVVATGFYETTVPARPTFDLGLRVSSVDVPTAFTALTTVQKLAPIARWAQGAISGEFAVRGALGTDMAPLNDVLTGRGSIESEKLQLQGVPVLAKLADSFALEQLRDPALQALRARFEITNGRLHVTPFTVRLAQTDVTVSGSNGVDQSLDYALALAVPRAQVDAAAGRSIARLASQAGKAGIDVAAAEVVQLGARVTGTVTNPTVKPSFAGLASSAREAAREVIETRVAAVTQKVDSAADEARRRARAEADRLTAEAERQAETVREEARTIAARVRQEGEERADALMQRATTPAARLAAQVGADRIRRESSSQADRLVREADARATDVVAQAKRRADALLPAGS